MAGPFPGMDPYVEIEGGWADFHNCLIAAIGNELGVVLPGSYVARLNERFEVVTLGEEPPRSDVLAVRFHHGVASEVGPSRSWATMPEPILTEVIRSQYDELRITWVEIRVLPDLELVTVVEVLSPVNKAWQGRQTYLAKRDQLHQAREPGGD